MNAWDYTALKNSWGGYSQVLVRPENDEELDKLVDFADHLIDETRGNEKHPLSGLLHIIETLIEEYEDAHIPEPPPDPVGCLKYLMEEHGIRQKDLTEIGSPGVISEVLSGKRELNKRQIKALSERFNCSPSVFI